MMRLLNDRRRRLGMGLVEFAIVTVVFVMPLVVAGVPRDVVWPTALWSVVMAASLVVRRLVPLSAVLLCAAGGVGLAMVVLQPVPVMVVALLVMYSVARHRRGAAAYLAWPVALAAAVSFPLRWVTGMDPGRQSFAALMGFVLVLSLFGLAWAVGRWVSWYLRHRQLEQQMTEQSYWSRTEQTAQRSELAEGRARSDVARELHDVVAHSLSVIVVQAEGARALAEKKPEAATQALDVIARTGRTSIHEMRRIVALLRGESEPSFGPTPSLPQIQEMVREAGHRITLEVPDHLPAVPDSLGLAAFRVVQESVTNFLKHAGPTAEATVHVGISPKHVTIDVSDDGLGVQAATPGHTGAGVPGMQERVLAMGGTFHAGPRSGGGYRVHAEIPRPTQLGQSWME